MVTRWTRLAILMGVDVKEWNKIEASMEKV